MKLSVLGGGGVRSPFLSKSIISGAEELGIDHVVFMDNDSEKLRIYGGMAKKIAQIINPKIHFTLTTDAKEALTDADFIITTLRVGQDEGRTMDERIALKHHVLGQETTGAGGFAMALRTIPVLIEYCQMAKDYAKPDVRVFNFTNPSGLVTQALRSEGFSNVYGICDAPSEFIKQIQKVLNVNEDEMSIECFGLNHLSWFQNIKVGGEDKTQEILNNPKIYEDTDLRMFDHQLIKNFGMLLNEYLYFYYHREKPIESIERIGKTRGETILEINNRMYLQLKELDMEKDFEKAFEIYMMHYFERENSYMAIESGTRRPNQLQVPTVEEIINKEDDGGYAGVALNFIKAILTGVETDMILSVPNNGSILGLADDDVIEVTCRITKDGAKPVYIGEVPELQMSLIRQVKLYERYAVEAIQHKNKETAIKALMVHPLINSYSIAKELVDEYLEVYKEYVGEWR